MSSSLSLSPALQALQQRLQHTFADPALLQRAITHRSFSAEHNERLEFLGDSVLNLAVSSLLYERLARLPEGDLSRVRANLVKQDTLHQLALGLQLPQVLRLGEGETKSGGKQRPSILADALEAVIGAVYLDAGFAPAQALVHRLFERIEINPQMQAASKDAKTALQEWLQARKMKPPQYHVVATLGEAHRQTFEVECAIAALALSARGTGASRRASAQASFPAASSSGASGATPAESHYPQPDARQRYPQSFPRPASRWPAQENDVTGQSRQAGYVPDHPWTRYGSAKVGSWSALYRGHPYSACGQSGQLHRNVLWIKCQPETPADLSTTCCCMKVIHTHRMTSTQGTVFIK